MAKNMKFYPHSRSIVESAMHEALARTRDDIHGDCNKYVRADKWTMRDTSYTQFAPDDPLTLQVVYDTPYAKKVYYTGTPSTVENANASLQLCQKAADERKTVWAMILGKRFAASIRKRTGIEGRTPYKVTLKKDPPQI